MSATAKGQPNGLATLDSTGKVPATQLAGRSAVAPLTATATLDFASISAGAIGTHTVTVTGAAAGDKVALGPPAAIEAGLIWCAYVSAANTVTIRLLNTTGGAVDPASASWKVAVFTT
ncbi:hypothetical protein Ssi03_50560 [Sphaerisporangium siamense]|uniref:Threonine/homoserine efflux transporter RhtA n=1 Tax=Sphaerisporangium siamense TaxID=795645 RepID=A0A7W7D8H3_9ACTN|nr:hypothetical protein [Sphaerisporangium siamense]MBB4702240.1 threonine/homoserine efflux transporter RhtA [Sphaerisporangium siamense]GII87066.1 hypothetical protein Ssi03_50560 [Sphaerisporangium siamense]